MHSDSTFYMGAASGTALAAVLSWLLSGVFVGDPPLQGFKFFAVLLVGLTVCFGALALNEFFRVKRYRRFHDKN